MSYTGPGAAAAETQLESVAELGMFLGKPVWRWISVALIKATTLLLLERLEFRINCILIVPNDDFKNKVHLQLRNNPFPILPRQSYPQI